MMIAIILAAALYSQGGNSNGNEQEPAFKVNYDQRTYSVGEEITFTFDGEADVIHFFSGEPGSRYEFSEKGEKVSVEKVEMSFGSQLSNRGEGRSCERYIYISDDFTGDAMDEAAIRAATWRNITDKFTLASNNTRTYTGAVDLSPFIRDEKPFHIAFKYINAPYTTDGPPPSFRVYEYLLQMTLENGATLDYISAEKGLIGKFTAHDFQAPDKLGANRVGGNYIGMQPTNKGPLGSHEVWVISKQIDASHVTLDRETGVIVKYSYEAQPRDCTYKFVEPGTYDAVFLGRSFSGGEETVCRLKIDVR